MIRGQIGVKIVFASKVYHVVPPSNCLDLWVTKIDFSKFFDHFDVREGPKTSFLSLFRLKNGSNRDEGNIVLFSELLVPMRVPVAIFRASGTIGGVL